MDSIARESLLLHAFGWWQFAVCLFAFAALMTIWWHLGRKKGDHGQVWLAVSVMCWSLSGLCEVYYSTLLKDASDLHLYKSNLASLKSILSLLNSFFILLALPYFRYLPGRFREVIQSEYWKYVVGIPFLLAIVPILAKYVFDRQYNFINDLDVYYSILTLIFLGAVLWESFAKRNLKLLSILALVCIIITFVAQLYKPLDNTTNQLIFSAIFKSCLIMIFFALALSWVKEIVESASEVNQIRFDNTKLKIQLLESSKVKISGLGNGKSYEVKLTNTQFEWLSIFIKKRLNKDPKDQWLSIPTDLPNEHATPRLLKAILNGVFGKEEWLGQDHFSSFIDCFRDRKNGKLRLRLLPENISLRATR